MSAHSSEKELYIYDADIPASFWRRFHELGKFRYLLQSLVIRDIKAQYKGSALGVLWSLLNPLGLMLVFSIVFSVLSGGNAPRQYPVFVLVGIIPWRFFSGSLMKTSVAITQNATLIKKVYFPRELLPVASLLSELVNFFFGFVVLILFLYAFGLELTRYALWIPVILLVQLIFALGLGFILSTLATFYRDVLMVLDVVLQAWFFLSPVFYSFETLFGETATLLGITFNPTQVMRWVNPMASIIDGYRTTLWGTMTSNGPVSMDPVFLLRTLVESLIILAIGYYVFVRSEHVFGEKL
ncbi:MAG: ABC transporter permease [Anaerolineae bacterium]|nr:ABC transporter permease [Anaerolineae bacterium]